MYLQWGGKVFSYVVTLLEKRKKKAKENRLGSSEVSGGGGVTQRHPESAFSWLCAEGHLCVSAVFDCTATRGRRRNLPHK